jgi:hypothetical protein
VKSRRLASPWPFLFTVTSRGLVQNLPPKVAKPKRSRLKRIPASDQWAQERLL